MTIEIEKELYERMDDYDFKECMKYAPFKLEEVLGILACFPGEADGDSWEYIVQLKNGKYGYVTGSCDYTGWGCKEGGDGKNAETVDEAISYAPEDRREMLKLQIDGKQPYALKS